MRGPGHVPFIQRGGTGRSLVFLHANGFPPACYDPLLELLSQTFAVKAVLQRPLWLDARPEDMGDWSVLSHDLLRFLEQEQLRSVIAVGHSMGAIAALRAAVWAPERFHAMVLLEPVLLPRRVMLEWWLVRATGLGTRLHPLIPGALRRQRRFGNLEDAYERYRGRPIFRYFSDQALRAYIMGMTSKGADGAFELTYSPEWEARVYDTGVWNDWDLWRALPSLRTPTLFVRGAESDTLRTSVTGEVARRSPQVRIVVMERATHLLPLERPGETSELIRGFVEQAISSRESGGDEMMEGKTWKLRSIPPRS